MPPRTSTDWTTRPTSRRSLWPIQGGNGPPFAADNRPESGLPPSPSPAPACEDEQESPHGSVGEIAQDQTSHQKRLDVDDAQILRRLKVGEQGHSGEDDGSEDALHRGTLHATILAHDHAPKAGGSRHRDAVGTGQCGRGTPGACALGLFPGPTSPCGPGNPIVGPAELFGEGSEPDTDPSCLRRQLPGTVRHQATDNRSTDHMHVTVTARYWHSPARQPSS